MPRSRDGIGERVIDGQALLVDARGGRILVLNETGSLLWSLLDGTRDVGALAAEIVVAFEVDEATARGDVEEFLRALADKDLLEPS